MKIIGQLFDVIAVTLSAIGLWWLIICLPLAIILLVIGLVKKNKKTKKKFYIASVIGLLGWIVCLVGGFLFHFIGNLLTQL